MNREITDVKFLISLKKLLAYGISAEEYFVLYLLTMKEKWKLGRYIDETNVDVTDALASLLELGYLDMINNDGNIEISNVISNGKSKDIIQNSTALEDIDDWFDEWYDLWPKGIKSGGYYIRSGKLGTKTRMKSFIQKYPEYTKDQIIKATKSYMMEQTIQGFTHTKLAHYFIEKEGVSTLAAECENLDGRVESENNDYAGEEL